MTQPEENYRHSFCCCGNLSDEACGWPQRTVRALLALTVVILGLGAEVAAAMWLLYQKETSLAISLIGLIATEVTGATAFYFGMSKGTPSVTAPIDSDRTQVEYRSDLEKGERARVQQGKGPLGPLGTRDMQIEIRNEDYSSSSSQEYDQESSLESR